MRSPQLKQSLNGPPSEVGMGVRVDHPPHRPLPSGCTDTRRTGVFLPLPLSAYARIPRHTVVESHPSKPARVGTGLENPGTWRPSTQEKPVASRQDARPSKRQQATRVVAADSLP